MTAAQVKVERVDGVIVAHLDDGKANALSVGMIAAIVDALDAAEADPDVGAFLLHGREGRFCAGFDLDVMRSGDAGAVVGLVSDGGDLVRRLYGATLPVVAACTGHALAAGALLLLACDVRVGADIDCKIGLNEVAIGLVLPDWALTIAAERLSRRHLQRAVATARITDGRGAVDAGFLDEVVPAAEVYEVALAQARALAALDRRAYAATVQGLRGLTVEAMGRLIEADRATGRSPTG